MCEPWQAANTPGALGAEKKSELVSQQAELDGRDAHGMFAE